MLLFASWSPNFLLMEQSLITVFGIVFLFRYFGFQSKSRLYLFFANLCLYNIRYSHRAAIDSSRFTQVCYAFFFTLELVISNRADPWEKSGATAEDWQRI